MEKLTDIWTRITSQTNRKSLLLIGSGLLILTGWLSGTLLNEPFLFNSMMIGATFIAGYDIVQSAWPEEC